MMSGTNYRQGDLLLVPFPFSDLSAVKQRPVLVLSRDTADDLVVCGVTSNLAPSGNWIPIDSTCLSEGVLPIPSMIRVDKLFSVERTIVRKRLGRVNGETLEKAKHVFVGLV